MVSSVVYPQSPHLGYDGCMSVDGSEPEYLSVRETARRLSVHENTVRNWARDGILSTARVPGSRFHRFDARDVERLRQQRGAGVSSVEQERRTIGPELVDGTQLSHWATTRHAQDMFPELVRRLLASTPGITNASVRSGDGVAAPGWDGRAESSGTTYLPNGRLCLELGVGQKTKQKAQQDYEKRTADPKGARPAECCFVFITARRWSGAAEWESARRLEGIWSDVRVVDADDLEGWLQATPVVHYWISEQLGRRPRDGETLERWWARFQAQTDPPLPAALFRAGRDAECAQLAEFLAGPPGGVIAVQASWRDEAIAFVCATIETADQANASSVQPPLVVSARDVWDRAVAQPGRMTLLPLFEDVDLASAQAMGHHVVIPIGREQVARGTRIELPRPHRQVASDALEAAGISADRTYHLAALARRSMPSLVRTLARDPRLARPPWSRYPAAAVLAPLVLVGAWSEGDTDTDVVSRMAGEHWSTIERQLRHWRDTDDPPFVRSSGEWHLASPEEAFMVLRDAVSPGDLDRWHQIAVDVLLETDPKLELPHEERPMAGVLGVTRAHSSVLRRGLADCAALVGSIGADPLSDGVSGADHARRLVGELLGRANADTSGQIWRSLADELPLLAEAAPEAFLDGVHDDLDADSPLLRTMFQDGDQSSWLYSSSPHTGLLWALETLCWSPEHLPEASRALARLHVIDPGGRLSNRPLESLQSILVPWIHHTAAPLDFRLRAVEQVCRQLPDVGWLLILALWPAHHSVASPPAAPRYRDWKPESRSVSIAEWLENINHLVQLAIELAANDPVRWAELTERLGPLPPTERERLLEVLDEVASPDALDPEGRLMLWEHLRKEVAQHRAFPDADWSMDEGPLSRMHAIADRLEPTANVERFAYLFDWRPDLPEVDIRNHDAYDQALLQRRTEAVSETIGRESADGLRRLAERSPEPSQLGWVVGAVAGDDLTPKLLTWLDSENHKLRGVAATWASQRMQANGVDWLVDALARPEAATPERRAALALSAPSTSEVWDAFERTDSELKHAYWAQMGPWRVRAEDAERAAHELLAHNRAWAAVDMLASNLHPSDVDPTSVTPNIVEEVLNAALTTDSKTDARVQSLGYEIGVLLDYLESEQVDPDTIARYEFLFFRLLDHHREPRVLFAALGRDPSLFVDLVSRVYRGKREAHRQLDEHEAALAHHAWWVLNHWRDLPGRRDDGTIDAAHLRQWVTDARLTLADTDRADIGDEQIGQVLAASPAGTDDIWPAETVREIIETVGSRSIEAGIHLGVVNQRGVTSRGVFDGGQQERDLAARYRQWAKQTAGNWPRTSRVLRGLAEDYERQAQREDARAELSADTE
jgi:excisionase family DNA binding protein